MSEDQIQQPDPVCSFGLLSLHDALEMSLILAATHLGLEIPQHGNGFMSYWKSFQKKAIELENQGAIERITKARAGFKHQGNLPNRHDLVEFMAIGREFLRTTVEKVFAIEFESVTLTDLIDHSLCREHLREAEKLISQSNANQALVEIDLAFRKYKNYFMSRMSPKGATVFSNYSGFYDLGDISNPFQELEGDIEVLELGIDYIDYAKYKLCVPNIFEANDGFQVSNSRYDEPSIESARFAFKFIMETILRLQRKSFEVRNEGTYSVVLATHAKRDKPDWSTPAEKRPFDSFR